MSVVRQIARDLGVSSATVSRALNDRPGVGAELRQRVLARASELHYTPSVTARGLATSQSFGLGFFVREKPGLPTASDPFYGEILQGVEQTVASSDYHVAIATLTDDVLARPADFRFVRERRVDAMVLAGPDIPPDFVLAMLASGLPVVLVDNRLAHAAANCVNSDDADGGAQVAGHLLALGHRRVGVLAGPRDWPSSARRLAGVRRAFDEAGLPPPEVQHAERTTIESGEAAARALLAASPDVTALCAVNDSMAIGAIRAARALGRRVPHDLSVTGYDDITWAALNDPPLTTISIPKRQMGKEAARRLLALLNDPDLLPTEILVSVACVERASTAAPS